MEQLGLSQHWADAAASFSENEIIRTTQAVMVVNTGNRRKESMRYLDTIEKIQLQKWNHAKQGVHKLFKDDGHRDITPIADSLKNLQMLYYRLFRFEPGSVWNRYENAPMPAQLCRVCPDPTPDHLRRVCHTARRSTTDRIVFHYLGYHSGTTPCSQNEWPHGHCLPLYNQALDEYCPISIHKLIGWLSEPIIYIFDCDYAGSYVDAFDGGAATFSSPRRYFPSSAASLLCGGGSHRTYVLASCGRNEQNPVLGPNLSSQLLTACLTAPLKTSLQFLCSGFYGPSSKILLGVSHDDKSPELEFVFERLGEATTTEDGRNEGKTSAEFRQLNSVFTSITNSIAWSTLRPETYEILFRQDAVLASLFRNYLLAQRLLSLVGVSSVSRPQLPDCSQHPLWEAWDFVLEASILHVIASERNCGADLLPHRALRTNPTRDFFNDQLRAFSVWLRKIHDREPVGEFTVVDSSRIPLELPILLQVLSHSTNRLCSLKLLAVYCDLGKSEIRLCLKAGLLPYLQKLLPKTSSTEASELVLFLCTMVVALESYEKSIGVPVSKPTSSIFSTSEYRYVLRLVSSETIDWKYRTLGCLLVAMLCELNPEIKRSNYEDLRAVEKLYRCLVSPQGGKLHSAALLALAVIFAPPRGENLEDSEWAEVVESRLVHEFARTPGLTEVIARSATAQEPDVRSAALLLVLSLLAIFGDRDYLLDSSSHVIESDKENTVSIQASLREVQQLPEVQPVKKKNASCSPAAAASTNRTHRRSRKRRARSRGGRTKKNGDLVHDLQSKASQCGMFFQNLSTAEYEKSLQNATKASLDSPGRAPGTPKGGLEFLCKLQEVSEDGSVTQRSALCRRWLLDLLEASDKVAPLANDDGGVLKSFSTALHSSSDHFHASTSIDFSDGCGFTDRSISSPNPCRASNDTGDAVTAAADRLIHSPQLSSLDWFEQWQDPFGKRASTSGSFASSDEMSCPESRPLLTAWNCEPFLHDSSFVEQNRSKLSRPAYHGG